MKFKHDLSTFLSALIISIVAVGPAGVANDNAPQKKADQPTYLLRYQFRSGQKLRYETVQQKTQQGIAEFGRKVDTTKINQRRLFTVGDVAENGEAKVSMQYEHVRMELKSDDKEPEVFDSKMESTKVPKRFQGTARNLKGVAPIYTVRAEGSPVSDEGVEQIPKGGQATFMIPLPGDEISVGDSWKIHMIVNIRQKAGVMREIILLRTYRLKAVEKGIATIGFSTSILTPVKAPSVKAQLVEARSQGEMLFDVKNGKLLKKEFRIDGMVLGALGPNTMLTAKGRTVETLMTDEKAVTSR